MPDYDCQTCGVCCHNATGSVDYVTLTPTESRRMRRLALPVVPVEGTDYLGTRLYGRARERVCIAFQGRIGVGCACSIYKQRPAECREFEAGSPLCRIVRREAGLPT